MSKYYLGIAQFVIVLPYDGSSSGTTFLRLNLSLSLSLSSLMNRLFCSFEGSSLSQWCSFHLDPIL